MSRRLTWIAALSCGWWLAAALVEPVGPMPLGDDGALADAVGALSRGEPLGPPHRDAASHLPHLGLEVVVARAFGPEPAALRFIGLVAGWLLVLATFALLRRLAAPRPLAALGAAAVLAAPPVLALGPTHMVHVPLAATLVAGAAAVIRYEETRHDGWWLAAVTLSTLAALDHPVGVALAGAWTLSTAPGAVGPRWAIRVAAPAAAVVIARVLLSRLLDDRLGPGAGGWLGGGLGAVADLSRVALAVGLASVPLALPTMERAAWRWLLVGVIFGLALAALGAGLPFAEGPTLGATTGPLGVVDGAPRLGRVAWAALDVVGGMGLFAIGRAAHRAGLPGRSTAWSVRLVGLLALLALVLPRLAPAPLPERDIALVLPFAIALLWLGRSGPADGPRARVGGGALALASLLVGVGLTHDWLAAERAREGASAWLARQGIPRDEVAGSAFDASAFDASALDDSALDGRDAGHAIVGTPPAEGALRATVDVRAWLPGSTRRLWLVRRE